MRSNLEELSLTKMLEVLPNVMVNSAKNKVPLADSLLELTNAKIEFRDERAKKIFTLYPKRGCSKMILKSFCYNPFHYISPQGGKLFILHTIILRI